MSCCCSTVSSSTATTAAEALAAALAILDPPRIYVGQVGVVFRLVFVDASGDAVDLTNATSVTLTLEDPNGSTTDVDLTPELDADESDGVLTYESVAEDLDVAGRWRYQGVAVTADDVTYRTRIVGFSVYPNL